VDNTPKEEEGEEERVDAGAPESPSKASFESLGVSTVVCLSHDRLVIVLSETLLVGGLATRSKEVKSNMTSFVQRSYFFRGVIVFTWQTIVGLGPTI
jgi:hypothetical protein